MLQGLAERICSFLIASELREKHPKIGVSHGRLWRELDDGSKTLLGFGVAAQFAGGKSFEIVERRIARSSGNGSVDRCEGIRRLAALEELNCLVVSCLSIGRLGQS